MEYGELATVNCVKKPYLVYFFNYTGRCREENAFLAFSVKQGDQT